MSITDRAVEALREAEGTLRSLLGEAAAAGDYGSVVSIAAWGRVLSDLLQGQPSGQPRTSQMAVGSDTRAASRSVSKPPRVAAKQDYPRFYRQKDRLVRVAWSKREKREYEQKAPYPVLDVLVSAISEKGGEGRIFGTDELLPLANSDGTPIPDYQAYLALALLKYAGLVDQHGRQGYSVRNVAEFRSVTKAVWRNLPTS